MHQLHLLHKQHRLVWLMLRLLLTCHATMLTCLALTDWMQNRVLTTNQSTNQSTLVRSHADGVARLSNQHRHQHKCKHLHKQPVSVHNLMHLLQPTLLQATEIVTT